MKLTRLLLLVCALTLTVPLTEAQTRPAFQSDPPMKCDSCAEWNAPQKPFGIFGNTYYVGVAGLSSVLVTSDTGHVLLDGGLQQSAALIDANIRALGFKTEDVKLIVNSHAHFDHAGGIAALQRASGAKVAASASGAKAIERGEPTTDDPQYAFGHDATSFPRVAHVQVVKDGEILRAGTVEITAHLTPGHTPGSTTWSFRSCEGARCLDVVYADSLTSVSAPGFKFTGDAAHPSLVASFEKTIATVESLPCDIVLSTHPSATGLLDRLKQRESGGPAAANPFIDANGCKALASRARKALTERVAEEKKK